METKHRAAHLKLTNSSQLRTIPAAGAGVTLSRNWPSPQVSTTPHQRKNSARVFPDGVRLCQMLDLNQRRHKPADLQSASFGRSDNLAYTTWCAQYPTTRLKDSLNALLGPGIDVLKRKAEQPGYGGQPPNRNRTSPGGPARRPAGGAAPQ